MIPKHLAENFAAGFAVIDALGLDLSPAVDAISSFKPMIGRGAKIALQYNGKKLDIICDYYNSSPQSIEASLRHFAQCNESNKIAVLGDMGELAYLLCMS